MLSEEQGRALMEKIMEENPMAPNSISPYRDILPMVTKERDDALRKIKELEQKLEWRQQQELDEIKKDRLRKLCISTLVTGTNVLLYLAFALLAAAPESAKFTPNPLSHPYILLVLVLANVMFFAGYWLEHKL